MNIISTDIPRHTKEEALADAVALKAAQDTDKKITVHVHTAISVRPEIMKEGQFTGYIMIR